jgi:hypothetical protein
VEIHVKECAGYPAWKQAKPTNCIRLYRGVAIGVKGHFGQQIFDIMQKMNIRNDGHECLLSRVIFYHVSITNEPHDMSRYSSIDAWFV